MRYVLPLLLAGCTPQLSDPLMPAMAPDPSSPPSTRSVGFQPSYLGGRPSVSITNGSQSGILSVFHSEFQWGESCDGAPCSYGTLGMGLSTDDGNGMRHLGQIIQPNPDRDSWIGLDPPQSLSIGSGSFVLGDINALAVDPRSVDPTNTYIYVFYPDYLIVNGNVEPGLAVARALVADVIAAAFGSDTRAIPALFHKYYNPDGILAARDAFTEPGVSTDTTDNLRSSGRFTPLLEKAFSPAVLYDEAAARVILTSTTTNRAGAPVIELRTSKNLVGWGSVAATIDESAAGLPN